MKSCNFKKYIPVPGVPIPKMAERVKLRRAVEEHHITETDILNTGVIYILINQ